MVYLVALNNNKKFLIYGREILDYNNVNAVEEMQASFKDARLVNAKITKI